MFFMNFSKNTRTNSTPYIKVLVPHSGKQDFDTALTRMGDAFVWMR
jgi:hypothetical protein